MSGLSAIPLLKAPHKEELPNLISEAWKSYSKQDLKGVLIHAFELSGKSHFVPKTAKRLSMGVLSLLTAGLGEKAVEGISVGTKVPPPQQKEEQPLFVACYQITKRPYTLTLLGFCERYKPNLRVKDLQKSLQLEPSPPPRAYEPDFFVFTQRPPLPEEIDALLLWEWVDTLCTWMKAHSKPGATRISPPEGVDLPVAFFVVLMAVFEKPEPFIRAYTSYLRTNMRDLPHGTAEVTLYGLLEKLRAEIRVLFDTRDKWFTRVQARLAQILGLIPDLFPQ